MTEVKKLVEQYQDLEKKYSEAKDSIKELEASKAKQVNSMYAGSDESKLLRKFSVAHVKDLLKVNVCSNKYSHLTIEDKMNVLELKKEIDTARYIAQMFYGARLDKGEATDSDLAPVTNIFDTKYAKDRDLANRLKAFGTGVSGYGAEWVPTAISNQYIEEYLLELKLINAFQEIPMPTNPFKLPVQKAGSIAKIVAEGSAATDGIFGTDALTFDAQNKFVELYYMPEELNEDSAVAILEIGRSQVVMAQQRAIESALLNGDTTGTHMDSDVTTGSDCRKAWKGLRKLALANSANGSVVTFTSAVSKTKLDEMLAAAGKFGINPRECMFVMSPIGYNQALVLDEVSTVEKFGQMATILTGALAAFRARPILISEFMREDLNASGVYDGTTVNNTAIILVNKSRFYLGRRRPIRVKVSQDPNSAYDRWQLCSYSRYDFQGMVQGATEQSVIIGVDVTA